MNKINKLDAWLLDSVFFSFAALTKQGNFGLSRIFFGIHLALSIAKHHNDFVNIVPISILNIGLYWLFYSLSIKVERGSPEGFQNPARVSLFFPRIFIFFLSVGDIIAVLIVWNGFPFETLRDLSLMIGLYFMSCNKTPPSSLCPQTA